MVPRVIGPRAPLGVERSRDTRYERLVSAAIEGQDSFERKRAVIDEYGWRDFGDIYADHENAFSGAGRPIVSHYNNQYDAVGGFASQFMRIGRRALVAR